MYYAYIIINDSRTRRYKGHCQNLAERIREHNRGKTRSIKGECWRYEYYEQFPSRHGAIQRERYWKSAAGRRWISKALGKLNDRGQIESDHE